MSVQDRFNVDWIFTEFQHREKDLSPEQYEITYLVTDQIVSDSVKSRFTKTVSSIEGLTDDQISKIVFYVYFLCDSDAINILKRINKCKAKFIPLLAFYKTNYRFIDRPTLEALQQTESLQHRISHFDYQVHENICEAINLTKNLEGDYVEIGVYMGGSALTALNYMSNLKKLAYKPKKVWLLDTFDGFEYEEANNSQDAIWAGTHKILGVENTQAHVKETLNTANIDYNMIVNNICKDDLPTEIKSIAVANIDVDMYETTLEGLNKVAPLVVKGGIIIAEDAASTPGLYGAYLALIEFLESDMGRNFTSIFKNGQYFLIRKYD
jgi:hypothetical protein